MHAEIFALAKVWKIDVCEKVIMSSEKTFFESFGPNSGYIEELYDLYQRDPALVGATWASFFSRLDSAGGQSSTISKANSPSLPQSNGKINGHPGLQEQGISSPEDAAVRERIYRMISAFRGRGHFKANINPLKTGVMPLPMVEDIRTEFYNFTSSQLEREYSCAGLGGRSS